jgi:hypothetical protein
MTVGGVPVVCYWHRKVSQKALDEESLKIQTVPHGELWFRRNCDFIFCDKYFN